MAKGVKKEMKPRTLPAGMTVEQMEEIFLDRQANLIVRLLDYLHEQKMKVKTDKDDKIADDPVTPKS
jgi:hypothetical protein